MRTYLGMGSLAALLATLTACSPPAEEHFNFSNTTKYSGRAFALQYADLRPTATPTPIRAADSGSCPIMGGEAHNFLDDAAPAPTIVAQDLDSISRAAAGKNSSQAWLAHLDAKIGPHHLTALWVESSATATAAAAGVHRVDTVGRSNFEDLIVDGQPTPITGTPNQTITFPDGYLVINEQSGSGGSHFGSITVNALHMVVTAGSLIAGSSKAEVINAPQPDAGPYDR